MKCFTGWRCEGVYKFGPITEEFPADEQKMPKFAASSFEKLGPAQTGVAFSHRMVMDHPLSRLNSSGFVCGRVCIGDFNGDGQADLFLANGPDQNGLFLQRDGFRFDNVTEQAGVGGRNRQANLSFSISAPSSWYGDVTKNAIE